MIGNYIFWRKLFVKSFSYYIRLVDKHTKDYFDNKLMKSFIELVNYKDSQNKNEHQIEIYWIKWMKLLNQI